MPRKLILSLILLLPLLTSACKSIPFAGECTETKDERCLLGKDCSWDEKRGCSICHCKPLK